MIVMENYRNVSDDLSGGKNVKLKILIFNARIPIRIQNNSIERRVLRTPSVKMCV